MKAAIFFILQMSHFLFNSVTNFNIFNFQNETHLTYDIFIKSWNTLTRLNLVLPFLWLHLYRFNTEKECFNFQFQIFGKRFLMKLDWTKSNSLSVPCSFRHISRKNIIDMRYFIFYFSFSCTGCPVYIVDLWIFLLYFWCYAKEKSIIEISILKK